MLNTKSLITVALLGLTMSLFLVSCEWEEYQVSTVEIKDVSFSTDIIPIFNNSCNSVGCHNEGGIAPDLSPANAFQGLWNTNMIDADSPVNSELYVRMIDVQTPMPIDGVLSQTVLKTVLVWIEEGALDN